MIRLIGDLEFKFGQLLLIAESALLRKDLTFGLDVLDEALGMEISLRDFDKEDFLPLVELLLICYREVDRVLTLARKTGFDPDSWLHSACLELIRSDAQYSIELLGRISNEETWFSASLESATRVVNSQPAVARRLLEDMIARAEDQGNLISTLEAATILNWIDSVAAQKLIERKLTEAIRSLETDDEQRKMYTGKIINIATILLANSDLPRALDFAPGSKCPDVVDTEFNKFNTSP